MKTVMIAILALGPALVSVQAAHASDLDLAPSSYDWEGAYGGVNAGAALDSVNVDRTTYYTGMFNLDPYDRQLIRDARDSLSADDVGFTGGVSAGYNWQMEQVVFGAEADLNRMGNSGGKQRNVASAFAPLVGDGVEATDSINYELTTFGTLRGRLGFAVDNVLLYGTGGFAYAHMKANAKLSVGDAGGAATWRSSEAQWGWGWTLGGGLEYGIGRWSVGAEYLYVDLQPMDWKSTNGLDLGTEWSWDTSFNVLRTTAKMRF